MVILFKCLSDLDYTDWQMKHIQSHELWMHRSRLIKTVAGHLCIWKIHTQCTNSRSSTVVSFSEHSKSLVSLIRRPARTKWPVTTSCLLFNLLCWSYCSRRRSAARRWELKCKWMWQSHGPLRYQRECHSESTLKAL